MKPPDCYSWLLMRTIALFDIDGTLLSAGGAGRRSLEIALEEVLGSPEGSISLHSVEFAGRTDPWIVRTALTGFGVAADDEVVAEVLRRYAWHLPEQLEIAKAFQVLPSVLAVLSDLSKRDDVILGLGTGNTKEGAHAKLAHGGLDSFFCFGGFGSDHTERAELLRVGLRRGLQRARVRPESAHVLVIGDTPHDVTAAAAIGAQCIAVATGSYDSQALQAAGAAIVVSNLGSPEVHKAFEAADR
ncbi:MAG: HAD family hydrolase [Myxococcales bacterium]